MKRIVIAGALVATMLLAGCGGREAARDITTGQLVGVWRQKNYRTLSDNRETVYKIYFTDDGRMYVFASFDALDIGDHTETLECGYSIEDNALRWTENDEKGYRSIAVADIQIEADRIVMTVRKSGNGRKITLIKASDTVPYAYTKEGMEQASGRKQALREEIIAFSEQFGERAGLPIRVNEEEKFILDVPGSVHFSSGDVNFHITQSKYAAGDGTYGYTIAIPSGAMNYFAPCYIVDGYAIVFDFYTGDIPQEWQNALE